MKTTRNAVAVIALLAGFAAFAHGGEKHLKGVITKVEGTSLTLAVAKGPAVVVMTDEKTEFTRADAKARLEDVTAGDKAVIHAKEHDEKLIAHVVKLAPAAKAAPAAGPSPKADKEHADHKH